MNHIDQGNSYPVFSLKPDDIAALKRRSLIHNILPLLSIPAAALTAVSFLSIFDPEPVQLVFLAFVTIIIVSASFFFGRYMHRSIRKDLTTGKKYMICGTIVEKIKERLDTSAVKRKKNEGPRFSYCLLLSDGYRLYVTATQFADHGEGERIEASKTVHSGSLLTLQKV